jgi:phage shock protein A
MLQQKLAERTKLLSQLEQAKMQEQVSASLNQMSQLAAPGNTPSLEEVRDKIEKRYSTALGSAELASNSVQGRMLEVQASTTEMAGSARLEQIRASLGGGSVAGQVTSGSAPASAGANIQAEIAQRVAQEKQS